VDPRELVAGNYGLESYTVNPAAVAAGTSYTAVPDDSAVNPPQLNSIDISYRVCQAQAPAYVVPTTTVRTTTRAMRTAPGATPWCAPSFRSARH